MKVYIIVALEDFGTDWYILKTVFTNQDEAIETCRSLNNSNNGYVHIVKEMELK